MKYTFLSACSLYLLFQSIANASTDGQLTPVTIGWQVPWATQGQIVQILKHTDTLEKNGLAGKFIGRTYGPLLNKIAISSNDLDVILTADQPAAALFSKNGAHGNGDWIAIGRLMYNRVTLGVSPTSVIQTVADLRGKKIGVPIGAAAERGLNDRLREAGINPETDTTIVNLGVQEQVPLMKSGDWQFDALAAFDPIPAIQEAEGNIRMIAITKIVSLVLMKKQYIDKHPGAAVAMMQSILDAYDYYRKPENTDTVDTWFVREARLGNVPTRALRLASAIEPNVSAKKCDDIRVTFTEDDFKVMQAGADFLEKKVGKVNMRELATNKYAKQALCKKW